MENNLSFNSAQKQTLPDRPTDFVLFFVKQHWRLFAPMAVCEFLHSGIGVLAPYALTEIVRSMGSHASPDALHNALILFACLTLSEILFGRAAGALQLRLAPIQRQSALRSLYDWLQGHSQRYLTSNFAGALAHRIGETSLAVNQILWTFLFDLMPVVITLAISTALLVRVNVMLGVIVGLWSCAFLGISWWMAKRSQPFALAAAATRSSTTGTLVDSVSHLSSAHLFARLQHERTVLDRALKKELKAIRSANVYTERIRWNQAIAFGILKLGTLGYSITLWQKGVIQLADFILVVTLGLLILNESRNLGRRFLELFEHIGNLNNGVRTLLTPHEIKDVPGSTALQVSAGQIEFKSVTFGYHSGTPVFQNLNVVIPPGQRVGLVGFSGSGKSTFVSLLLRMYDIQSGEICIDGQNIALVTQDSLHEQVGLIPQDPSLFHRSLMDNIRYGRLEATDEEVKHAAALAHADEFISQIKEGYTALVGERGVKLSGGQRQRIAIARALLKDAPILLLDEATSSLDSITERTIQETLSERMIGKTVIVIAHRLSTVAHLDRLLVFSDGRIVEDGSHAALLELGGLYARLWQMQSDGFLGDGFNGEPDFLNT
jgi:ATP-binding cassette subfamily B protein